MLLLCYFPSFVIISHKNIPKTIDSIIITNDVIEMPISASCPFLFMREIN